jgi:hypothetical protein
MNKKKEDYLMNNNKNGIEMIRFELIIPKYRNDQTQIPQERIDYYKQQIGLFAGGASEIDSKGIFIGKTKKMDFDKNITLQIGVQNIIETQTQMFLKLLCKDMAEEFGQEQVWLSKNNLVVDYIEGKRDTSKTNKDLIIQKKELHHLIIRFLEEEYEPEGWTELSLLADINRNAHRFGIDINKINPKKELEFLIENGCIKAIDMKIKAFDIYDPSVYEYIDDPELVPTTKGKDLYLNANIKSRLQE